MVRSKAFVSVLVLVLALVLAPSIALAVDVDYSPIVDSIDSQGIASYNFNITNFDEEDHRYQIYTINAYWDVSPTIVSVPKESVESFLIEINLLDTKISGPQLVPVTIKKIGSEDSTIENLYVYVKPLDGALQQYVPNVAIDVRMADALDPRKTASLEVYMRNKNPLDIKDMRIVIDSPLFKKEVQTTLGPLEEKTNQILFLDVNDIQQPGTYKLDVSLVVQNKTLAKFQKEIKILSYSDVSLDQTTVKGLFSYTETIKIHNDGNSPATKLVRVEKSFAERLFTRTSARYVKQSENGVAYLTWNVPLEPQESYTISVRTDYTPIVIFVLLIIAGVIIYYILRSPLLLFKRAKILSSSEEGISEIKVKLHLKNRSGQVIKNIKVIDKYPKLVQLVDDTSIGTLKPARMQSADKTHSLLVWNLESLDPYEERLLSYTLRSGLNIVGNVSLKAAKVKFQSGAGERTYFSNDVTLLHKSQDIIKYE